MCQPCTDTMVKCATCINDTYCTSCTSPYYLKANYNGCVLDCLVEEPSFFFKKIL